MTYSRSMESSRLTDCRQIGKAGPQLLQGTHPVWQAHLIDDSNSLDFDKPVRQRQRRNTDKGARWSLSGSEEGRPCLADDVSLFRLIVHNVCSDFNNVGITRTRSSQCEADVTHRLLCLRSAGHRLPTKLTPLIDRHLAGCIKDRASPRGDDDLREARVVQKSLLGLGWFGCAHSSNLLGILAA